MKSKIPLIFASLGILLIAGLTIWVQNQDPLYASASKERDDVVNLFTKTWDEYLSERADSQILTPISELSDFSVRHESGNQTLIELKPGPKDERVPPAVSAILANEDGEVALPGGGKFKLLAYALSVPKANDPTDLEDSTTEPLTFWPLQGSSPLTHEELDELGVPEASRAVSRAVRWFPNLRLVFELQGVPFERITEWRAFDTRTHAMVTQAIDRSPPAANQPVILDVSLGIWHETDLTLAVELACGAAVERAITFEDGFQTDLAPHARFQLLTTAPGRVKSVDRKQTNSFVLSASTETDRSFFAYRMFPAELARQTMFRFERDEESEMIPLLPFELAWADLERPTSVAPEATVVFLPKNVRAVFSIPKIKGMPNPRNPRNLFDINIPRFYLPELSGYGNESNTGYILVSLVSAATETDFEAATMTFSEMREGFAPKLYQNVTPRELLEDYLKNSADPYVYVDRGKQIMNFHRPEPWRVRLENWWNRIAPDWAR